MKKLSGNEKAAYGLSAVFMTLALIMMGWGFKIVWEERPYKVPEGYKLVAIEGEKKQGSKAKAEVLKYDLGEMFIKGPKTAKAGQAEFEAKNVGAAPHELVVLKTEKPADSLGSGGEVPEPGKVGDTGVFNAGVSKDLKLKLEKGHYALICNVPGHYAAGMHADLEVQ